MIITPPQQPNPMKLQNNPRWAPQANMQGTHLNINLRCVHIKNFDTRGNCDCSHKRWQFHPFIGFTHLLSIQPPHANYPPWIGTYPNLKTIYLPKFDTRLTSNSHIGLGKENKNATYEKVQLLVPQIKGCEYQIGPQNLFQDETFPSSQPMILLYPIIVTVRGTSQGENYQKNMIWVKKIASFFFQNP